MKKTSQKLETPRQLTERLRIKYAEALLELETNEALNKFATIVNDNINNYIEDKLNKNEKVTITKLEVKQITEKLSDKLN